MPSISKPTATCETCRWLDVEEFGPDKRYGECHRYPPRFDFDVKDHAFVIVERKSWCGEHSPKQEDWIEMS
jgi:hypothetical protein